MEVLSKTIETPLGVLKAPLHPKFSDDLKKCDTNQDLFRLVESSPWGHINPDAWNEVEKRGLVGEYKKWRDSIEVNKTDRITDHKQ